MKIGIQFAYFIFIEKSRGSKIKILFYNIIWLIIFILYFIFIWIFNNSLCNSAHLTNYESSKNNFYEVMKKLKNTDIIGGVIIISAHILKSIFIHIDKGINYSKFINKDK